MSNCMILQPFEQAATSKVIDLGISGENDARLISFDITKFVETFGEGVPAILVERPTETYSYPVVFEREGNILTWSPGQADVYIPGNGRLTVRYSVDEVVVKTLEFITVVHGSLATEGEPPEPIEEWVDEVLDAKEEIENMTASAEITSAGDFGVTVTKSEVDDHINLDFSFTGFSADKTYIHRQLVPSNVWVINHDLNKMPSVTIVDSADDVMIGDVRYLNENQVVIVFTSEFSGKAYLN